MPGRATRAGFRAAAASAAAVAAMLLAASLSSAAPGERANSSHVFVGVTPNSGFGVRVNGEAIPSSPVLSSDLGIVSFDVDEAGLPSGPRSVVIGDPGELVISNVLVDGVTTSSATVHWTTNLPSSSSVEYGVTSSYGSTASGAAAVITHSVQLSGLAAGTTYHFRVSSDDGQGHAASSQDSVLDTSQTPLVLANVSVDSVGQTWAAVSWTTNRPADSLVEYGTTLEYGFATPLYPALVETHHVTVQGLAPGTVYHMRALSGDGSAEPSGSEDSQFATDLPPLSLYGVEVSGSGDTWATIGWTTGRPADSQVEYGLSDGYGSSSPVDPGLVTKHEVTLHDLIPGSTYHFRARSRDVGGDTALSGDQTFDTGLAALGLWNVGVTQVGQTWAIVRWLTDRPSTSVVAYGETDDYGWQESPGDGFVTEHSATLSGLAEGTLYHFRVSSVDEQSFVAMSSDSTFSTMEVEVTGPPQMDGVDFYVASTTSVVVTWTTDRPATSQVKYGTGEVLDNQTRVDTTAVTEHSVLVWPVAPRIEYSFVAVSACGCDTVSCPVLAFQTSPPAVEAPIVKPVDIIKIIVTPDDGASAVVTWASDRPCSSWVDYGRDASYGSSVPGVPLGASAYVATLPDLAPGETYHLRVSAWDVVGGEVAADDIVFETVHPPDDDPPARPTGVTCTAHGGEVRIAWDENSEPDLVGYNVYRARSRLVGIDWSRADILNSSPVPEPEYVDTSVEPGASYAYAVTAVDASCNESERSESAGVEIDDGGPGAIHFAAYPNPARDDARFVFTLPPGAGAARLRILSPSGRVVMERGTLDRSSGEQTVTWNAKDPSGWPVGEGVYLCELQVGDSVERRKLTVLR